MKGFHSCRCLPAVFGSMSSCCTFVQLTAPPTPWQVPGRKFSRGMGVFEEISLPDSSENSLPTPGGQGEFALT